MIIDHQKYHEFQKYHGFQKYCKYCEHQKYHEYRNGFEAGELAVFGLRKDDHNKYCNYHFCFKAKSSDLKKAISPLVQYPGCHWRRQRLP